MAEELDSLGSLEERIRRTVDLVASLRTERDAAIAERDSVRKATAPVLAETEKLRTELAELREERQAVRERIEKLLGQIDLVSS